MFVYMKSLNSNSILVIEELAHSFIFSRTTLIGTRLSEKVKKRLSCELVIKYSLIAEEIK